MAEIERDGLTYYVYEEPERKPSGVASGYLVVWTGEPGPGQCMPVAALTEDDGTWHIVRNGEFSDVTITAG